jgi:DNA-binding protein Fis
MNGGNGGLRLELGSWCLRDAEEQLIRLVMESCEGNRSQAARELGIHRTTLYEKMRRYGMAERESD